MPTIFFDVHGLVNYPGFANMVVKPLRRAGKDVRFWTYDLEEVAFEKLKENGLGGFAHRSLVISSGALDENYDLHNLVRLVKEGRLNTLLFSNFKLRLNRMGLKDDQESIERVVNIGGQLLEYSLSWKYPPLFGEGNYLLVESDCSVNTGEGIWRDEPFVNDNTRGARFGKYSLIILPEYPAVWQAVNTTIKPEDILKKLEREITVWGGRGQIIMDLGDEMGIYQERQRPNPERR